MTTPHPARRPLRDAHISAIGPIVLPDDAAALRFLSDSVGATGLAVVESTDTVGTVAVGELLLDSRVRHAHAFSHERKSQARVARRGTGWVGDSVHECKAGDPGARPVGAVERTQMCLGSVVEVGSGGATLAEARINRYTLPLALCAWTVGGQADVIWVEYHEPDSFGRFRCTAHRVDRIGPRALKKEN